MGVRPDWAKKLADARAHAMRRSAAATALHNAAYMMNDGQSRGGLSAFSRRRRTLFSDSPGASGSGTPQQEGKGIRKNIYMDYGADNHLQMVPTTCYLLGQ